MKSLAYDPVVTCDEIMDTTETASIDSNHNPNCWVIAVVHLAITCLLLLLVINEAWISSSMLNIVLV